MGKLQRLAQQGDAAAQNKLGHMYEHRSADAKDREEAVNGTGKRLSKDMPLLKAIWGGCIELARALPRIGLRRASGFKRLPIRVTKTLRRNCRT